MRGGGGGGCLGQGPAWAIPSPCRGLRVRWEPRGSGQNRLLSVAKEERLPMWTDGSPGLRRRSLSANQEHFLSADRQRANSSMSWKLGTGGGRSAEPFLSVGFTQRNEGAGCVSDPESLFICCILVCFYVSSCNTWRYSVHGGHTAVVYQTSISQEPLLRLQSLCPTMCLDLFRSWVISFYPSTHMFKESGRGQAGRTVPSRFLALKKWLHFRSAFFTEQPHRHKALLYRTWSWWLNRVLCLARDFPHLFSYWIVTALWGEWYWLEENEAQREACGLIIDSIK